MAEANCSHRRLWTAIIGAVAGGILAGGIAIVALVVLIAYHFAPASKQTLAELRTEGDEIVLQIEAHKVEHGKYPLDFASARISPGKHFYGEWRYAPSSDRSSFTLWIWIERHGWLMYELDSGWRFAEPDPND